MNVEVRYGNADIPNTTVNTPLAASGALDLVPHVSGAEGLQQLPPSAAFSAIEGAITAALTPAPDAPGADPRQRGGASQRGSDEQQQASAPRLVPIGPMGSFGPPTRCSVHGIFIGADPLQAAVQAPKTPITTR